MGMMFPMGMKLASRQVPDLTAWFWGVNGAASVCSSVFSVAVSLFSSISVRVLGLAWYVMRSVLSAWC